LNEVQKANSYIDSSELVANIKEYLIEKINEKISLDDICKHFGVGQTALMKKFRIETNQTVIEYFNELKIGRAKELIGKTSKSFSAISDELGFSSINYFSKLFKSKTGMTLTEYSMQVSKRKFYSE
jgi:AraC-like DNA-binding protein